jgi:SAM-dependent methyltransferase
MQITPISSSFRDPSGFLFRHNDVLYRKINPSGLAAYRQLKASGLYEHLVSKNLLTPHTELDDFDRGEPGDGLVIQPQEIPFISYPYEWSFEQLRDAALLTLRIQKIALKHSMSLKDASAFNIQFVHGKPVFIDTLSFEDFRTTSWVAYKQFCQHFLAPLCLSRYRDHRLVRLLINHIDGIPLDLASQLLPVKSYFNFGVFLHLHLHAKYQKKYSDKPVTPNEQPQSPANLKKALALTDFLASTVRKLNRKNKATEWGEYYLNTNYKQDAMEQKKQFVESAISQLAPGRVVDLGANNGEFSRIASAFSQEVLSIDIDELAVQQNYQQCQREGITNILPLIQDLTNPSPAIGWHNQERMSLPERCRGDTCLALALIHHLAISNNLPLENIALFLANTAPNLIIEFIPKSDSQVKRLLTTREDVFPQYHQIAFEAAFSAHFAIVKKETLTNSERTIYQMKKLPQ